MRLYRKSKTELELLIDSPESVIKTYTGEVVIDEPVINVPNIPDVVVVTPDGTKPYDDYVEELKAGAEVVSQPLSPYQKTSPILQAPTSDSETVSDELAWMEGFTPSIIMMGRSVSNTGFYTCPYWIYDWMKQNPDWYKHPDSCPHYSARQTLKSLAWYMHRDGMVTVRETRNSQFYTFKK
ncbi:minor capsid protein inhibitor of protease [Klebsiella phage CPRSA]|nr:minor capsid protein inhibitor of protease [Klebsiella phage CPRSA]